MLGKLVKYLLVLVFLTGCSKEPIIYECDSKQGFVRLVIIDFENQIILFDYMGGIGLNQRKTKFVDLTETEKYYKSNYSNIIDKKNLKYVDITPSESCTVATYNEGRHKRMLAASGALERKW